MLKTEFRTKKERSARVQPTWNFSHFEYTILYNNEINDMAIMVRFSQQMTVRLFLLNNNHPSKALITLCIFFTNAM